MKEWLTAREIAELKLPGVPADLSSVIKRAKREGWQLRQRSGSGGGREYHISSLPPDAREAYERPHRQEKAAQAVAVAASDVGRQIACIAPAALTARQRAVMEARAAILLEIDRRMMADRLGLKAAIRSMVADSLTGAMPEELLAAAATANDRSGGSPRLSERSLLRWRAARDDGGAVAALAPKLTSAPEPLPSWFGPFLRFYARPQKPTIARALENWRIAAVGETLPSYQQVRRALDKLGSLDKARGREGAQALKSRQAYTARDTSDLLPTSVYLADGKTFDAEVQHPIHGQPFRPEVTTIIDAHTRKITGFSAALDESAGAVANALRAACAVSGIPAIFYTDNGPGYKNKAMDAPLTGLLGRLGITAMRALPYNSQAKGIVERVNHEWSHLARNFASYISRDMDPEAKMRAHKRSRRELALTGTSRVLPTWHEFLDVCLNAIERYNARPHSALPKMSDPETGKWRHMSPNEMWDAAVASGFEPLTVTADESTDLFRPWVIRKTRRALVEWLNNEYFAIELERYHDTEVIVAYDVQDADQVWVRAIDIVDGERQPGQLIAVAKWGGHKTRYVPLTAERAALEARHKARRQRLQGHLDTVDQELRPAAMLDARVVMPMPMPMIAPAAPVAIPAAAAPIPAATGTMSPGGRPTFGDDVQFARWLIANPDATTASDVAYVRDLLSSQSTRDLLRMSGIDLAALQALARAAA